MHQSRFRLGSAPDPAGRAYSVPPDSLAVFKRPTSKGREGKGRGGKEGRGGEGKGEGEGLQPPSPNAESWLRHWMESLVWSRAKQGRGPGLRSNP